MSFITPLVRTLAVAYLATVAVVGFAQADPSTKPVEQKKAAATTAKENAKQNLSSGADIQRMLEQLGIQRDALIAGSEELSKKLKDATDAQKKEILEKMGAQKKAFEEATSALQRQIADERRKQRQGAAPKR